MTQTKASTHHAFRKLSAVVFWLHAFAVTRLLEHFGVWNRFSQMSAVKLSLVFAIVFYAYVAENATWSMIVDALYIYVSPVVLLGRMSWVSLKLGKKKLFESYPVLEAVFSLETKGAPTVEGKKEEATPEKNGSGKAPRIVRFLSRPLFHFPILWCFLIAISSEKYILVPALVAVIFLAFKGVFGFHEAIDASLSGQNQIELRFRKMFETVAEEASKADKTAEKYQQTIRHVLLYRSILGSLASTDFVKKLAKSMTLALALPTYIYISILCGFASFAIGRLGNLNWGLADALVNSLFMPIAYTDLPHNYAIRILGGIQVASLLMIGYDAIFRSIDRKMEGLSAAAKGLYGIFESEQVATAIKTYEANNVSPKVESPEIVN